MVTAAPCVYLSTANWPVHKKKVLESCSANLFAFLLKSDPSSLEELTRLGDQYCSAHPISKVQREMPFNAVACEASFKLSYEEVEGCADQRFFRKRPQHQGRSCDKRSNPQVRCTSEKQHTADRSNPPERKFRCYSIPRWCRLCGSWWRDDLFAHIKSWWQR